MGVLGHAGWLEQIAGALLVLLVLVDVFLAVLYARAGAGIISRRVARSLWHVFLSVSKASGKSRGQVLALCGPAILVTLVAVWAVTLVVGMGLIFHPKMGSSVVAASGPTPTDFIAAMYAAGCSVAIVGGGDFQPATDPFRFLYLLGSMLGVSIMTLTLTYLMQIYTALHHRNTLGLKIHLLSAETGDAAVLLAGLAPGGDFNSGSSILAELAAEMSAAKESHHFYPVLFYFRFREPFYSISRSTLVALDAVALIRTALPEPRYQSLQRCGAVDALARASLHLVTTLEHVFVRGGPPQQKGPPDEDTRERWRRRYFSALRQLSAAGIPTVAGEEAGAEAYIALRSEWDRQIATITPTMGYSMEEIDLAGTRVAANSADPVYR
jgi:hypothetical protein